MADMDETGQTGVEEDPAAAFLAREQDELADIAGDTLGFGTGDSVVSRARGTVRYSRLMYWYVILSPPTHTRLGRSPYSRTWERC